MEILASDKTGTLTLNRLQLDKEEIVAAKGYSAEDVLLLASLSAKWSNNDAIDKAVTGAMGGNEMVSPCRAKACIAYFMIAPAGLTLQGANLCIQEQGHHPCMA